MKQPKLDLWRRRRADRPDVWVHYSAHVFLFGAELTKAIVDVRNRTVREQGEEQFDIA